MCGIFGYANYFICVSHKHILDTLVTGLRRLEYRGYDSAGLAVDSTTPLPAHPDTDPNSQPITAKHDVLVIKSVGSVNKLEASVAARLDNPSVDPDVKLDRHVGIAHTRWATHGAPSTLNSHPHVSDPSAQFVVVHNGIITNYKPLKEMLVSKGTSFDSDTDTEVIAKLTKYLYETVREDDKPLSFPRLVMNVMHQMDGAYALLIKSTAYPNQLIACKVGSPLVMGMKPSNHEEEIAVIRSSITDNAPKSANGSHHNGSHASNPDMIGATNGKAVPTTTNGRGEPKNGTTETEYFLSSDASAIVEHTDKVVYFEDNDLVHIDETGELTMFSVGNFETTRAIASNRAIATLDMELEQIMKGSYPHFMLKEIFEQPESLTQTMRGRVIHGGSMSERDAVVPGMADVHLGGLSQRIGDLRRSSRIIFVACGTSFHSCLAARQVMEELTELPVSIELASDFLDRQTPLFRSDVCVFVSQSGETADTLEALRYAKRCQALTVGIVNVVGSSIARLTDCGVHTNAGAEIGVASTKAYTSQIMVMVIIALQLSLDSRAKQMRRRQIHKAMIELPSLVKRTLSELDDRMKTVAERLRENSSILLFGRGYQYATCLEGALKIKEVSYIHTEGIHAGELKHGPLALIDENMPVILFASQDACATKVQNALHQVLARGGFSNMIIVGTEGDAEIERYREKAELILVPKSVDCLQAVLNIIPMQLLSYHLAVARGLNVDQPRSLAKSVTVE